MRSSAHVSEASTYAPSSLPEHERPPAKWIAHRDQFALAHDEQRKRAFDPTQCAQDAAAIVGRLSEQMQNDFAIGCGLENRTFAFQFIAQDSRRSLDCRYARWPSGRGHNRPRTAAHF